MTERLLGKLLDSEHPIMFLFQENGNHETYPRKCALGLKVSKCPKDRKVCDNLSDPFSLELVHDIRKDRCVSIRYPYDTGPVRCYDAVHLSRYFNQNAPDDVYSPGRWKDILGCHKPRPLPATLTPPAAPPPQGEPALPPQRRPRTAAGRFALESLMELQRQDRLTEQARIQRQLRGPYFRGPFAST